MVKLVMELLGSPMKDALNTLGKWHREGEKVYASRAKVLDYGCGEGDGTVFLKSMFPFAEVKGVDFWPGAIERAKVRWSERDVIWKVGDVTVPDEKAHIIVSTCTIDHVDDIGGTIERLRNWGTWIVVNWGVVNVSGHPSMDQGWTENCEEPFWSKQYLQPRLVGESTLMDRFQVFVWRGR